MKALPYCKYIVVYIICLAAAQNVDDIIKNNPDLEAPDEADLDGLLKELNGMLKDPSTVPVNPPIMNIEDPSTLSSNPLTEGKSAVELVKGLDDVLKRTGTKTTKNELTRRRGRPRGKNYSKQVTANINNLNELLTFEFFSIVDIFNSLTKTTYISKDPALADTTGAERPIDILTVDNLATDKKNADMASDFALDTDLDMLENLHNVLGIAYAGCKGFPCQPMVSSVFSKYITFMAKGQSAQLSFIRKSMIALREVNRAYQFFHHGFYNLGEKTLTRTRTYADDLVKTTDVIIAKNDELISLTQKAAVSAGTSGNKAADGIRNQQDEINNATARSAELNVKIAETKTFIEDLQAQIKAKEALIDTEVIKITHINKTLTVRGACKAYGWNVRGGRVDDPKSDRSGSGGEQLDQLLGRAGVGGSIAVDNCDPEEVRTYVTEERGTNFELVEAVQALKQQLEGNVTDLMLAQIQRNADLQTSIGEIQQARRKRKFFIAAQRALQLAVQQLLIAKTAFEQIRHYWKKLGFEIGTVKATDDKVKIAMSTVSPPFKFNPTTLASLQALTVTNALWSTAASWLRVGRKSVTGYRRYAALNGAITTSYIVDFATIDNIDPIIKKLKGRIDASNNDRKKEMINTLKLNAKIKVIENKTTDAIKDAKAKATVN